MIERIALSQGGTGDLGRSRDQHASSPISATTPPRSPTSSRRRRPAASPRSPAPPTTPAGARSIRSTFASKLVPNIHVIGDACIAGGIPKSASARNAQGKACAAAIVAMLAGKAPETPRLTGACYNTVAPGYAFSLSGIYQPKDGQFAEVEGGDAARSMRRARCAQREAEAARNLVQDDHGGSLWLDRRPISRSAGSPACCSRCPARPARRRCGPTPSSATPFRNRSRPARATRRAAARSSSNAPALASSATAAHFPNRNSRAIWRPTLPVPAAAGPKASFGCGWWMRPASMPRPSCRPIIASTACNRVGTPWRGKPILSAEQIEDIVAYLVTLRE